MFSMRTNPNLALSFSWLRLTERSQVRLLAMSRVEHFCAQRGLDLGIFKGILMRHYFVEWTLFCRGHASVGWHGLLRSVLGHYKSLRSRREISALSNYDLWSRSFVFDRRRGWESPLLSGGQLGAKLAVDAGKRLFEDFRWSRDFANIHFIRTQRRYNKRRYARMRAVSRPSFWSGSLMSSMGVGMFWGATMQLTDWFVNQLIYVDVTNALLIMYVYALWRVCVTLGRGEL